jgi:hypothetical protein
MSSNRVIHSKLYARVGAGLFCQSLPTCQHVFPEVNMRNVVKIASLGVVLCSGLARADAPPHSLTLTNQSGSAITAITAIEKTAPDTVLPFVFSGELSNLESDTATIDLPDGVCVVDVTYALASGEKIVQQNVDLCSIDGVIVE